MKKLRVGLLLLIALVQVLTIAGIIIGYREMFDRLWKSTIAYKKLYEETHPQIIIDFRPLPNPFNPVYLLVLFGLFLTIVLLIDEVRRR